MIVQNVDLVSYPGYLHARILAIPEKEYALQAARIVLDHLRKLDQHKLLLEFHQPERLSFNETFQLIKDTRDIVGNLISDYQIALLEKRKDTYVMTVFAELVSVLKGFDLKYFTSEKQALKWFGEFKAKTEYEEEE